MGLIFPNRLDEVAAFGVNSVMGFGELFDVLELFDVGGVDAMNKDKVSTVFGCRVR